MSVCHVLSLIAISGLNGAIAKIKVAIISVSFKNSKFVDLDFGRYLNSTLGPNCHIGSWDNCYLIKLTFI